MKNILVTGGAGFIGSNFIQYLLVDERFDGRIINLDKLTYAGNLDNLKDINNGRLAGRYAFVKGDIADIKCVEYLMREYAIDTIVNFAAESHVDRSIHSPEDFIRTNILGTFNLLEVTRREWKDRGDVRFHQISTDEVYGSADDGQPFREDTPYDPSSPYSASKASSDHLVRAYGRTYGLPITISNCSNNYGPYQFPEKLIPLMISNAIEGKPLPVYGDGRHVRDWLYVTDHCSAIWAILERGCVGETYNISGGCRLENIALVGKLCKFLDDHLGNAVSEYTNGSGSFASLITYVADRPGHDRIYAVDSNKIEKELGWSSKWSFDGGLAHTVGWYLENKWWVQRVKDGTYMDWIKKNYDTRSYSDSV